LLRPQRPFGATVDIGQGVFRLKMARFATVLGAIACGNRQAAIDQMILKS